MLNLMTVSRLLIACCLPFLALPLAAQEKGQWRAMSNTARAITGDIYFTDTKLAINFTPYTIAQIRELEPDEAKALFNIETAGVGNLYRLDIPADKRFLHKNTLCGSDPAQWAITWVSGKTLELAFMSGPSIPPLTADAISNSTRLCGTFNYTR